MKTVKFVNQTLAFFSIATLNFLCCHAKSIEFLIDHKTKETIQVEESFPEDVLKKLEKFQQLKIENIGNLPIEKIFPYTTQEPYFSTKKLAKALAHERYPILHLYQIWKEALVSNASYDSSIDDSSLHPLDLMNFKGICSPEIFHGQFIKLCNALGIETAFANLEGTEGYDFRVDDEWSFLDLTNHQLYLGWDNETLVSSEQVMDDPLLALRTKHQRKAAQFDFKETWKQLAAFNIIDTASSTPVFYDTKQIKKRAKGVDLYPKEALLFETAAMHKDLAPHECLIAHHINLETRFVSSEWKHTSVFPITHFLNQSEDPIHLIDQDIVVNPGESLQFKQPVFHLSFSSSNPPIGKIVLSGVVSSTLFPTLMSGKNTIYLKAKENNTLIRFHYELNDQANEHLVSSPRILNENHLFDHSSPQFNLDCGNGEKIHWQIGMDPQFEVVPSTLDQIEEASSTITLQPISETFLNPETPYYFRFKASHEGQWSHWSSPFLFTVAKPLPVEQVIFEEGENEGEYLLNWERHAEPFNENLEYLVFASNALDFIPSVYCDTQINAIVDGEVTEEEKNDNLISMTTEPQLKVSGRFAYYRIIARRNGQLSVPSPLVRVYDEELVQPRTVLQTLKDEERFFAKRLLFPPFYPWSENALPRLSKSAKGWNRPFGGLIRAQLFLRSASSASSIQKDSYQFPNVSEEIWEEVRPYLLPEGHPAWPQLKRIFCKTRVVQSPLHFKRAGFVRYRPGRWSRVCASSHPYLRDYFIKAYCDDELGIIYDWKRWIHRIKGAETVRTSIIENKLEKHFKVPHKWIFALPLHPSPPKSRRIIRKNFVLVCENMNILAHSDNEKRWKKMSREKMIGVYTLLQSCGLYDSTYVFNIPYCKDGKIAVIDTEYYGKWAVPFDKLTKYLPKNLQSYWKQLTRDGGKIRPGKPVSNPSRMDRRDVIVSSAKSKPPKKKNVKKNDVKKKS